MPSRDLILSSGYLAFARHVGFLRAVETAGVEVGAICGTSSGALAAALWAAGMPARELGAELSAHRPARLQRFPNQVAALIVFTAQALCRAASDSR